MKNNERKKKERTYSWRDVYRISIGPGTYANRNERKQTIGTAREILSEMAYGYLQRATQAEKDEIIEYAAIFLTCGDEKLLALLCSVLNHVDNTLEVLHSEDKRLEQWKDAHYERMIAYLRELPSSNARKAAIPSPHVIQSRAAKARAFGLWQDWRNGKTRYKSGAAFARHVVKQLPAIENVKTVERWATQWLRGAKTKK